MSVATEVQPSEAGTRGAPGRAFLAEPRRLPIIRAHPNAPWFAVGAVCVGAFMGQLDASIVTLAFPSLEHGFHAGLAAVSWVALIYLLVLVAAVSAMGRLADMVGRKLIYLYGFAIFALGSGLCALAPSLGALDAFRALQALGAAMLQANSLAIITLVLPRRSLAKGLGIQGGAQALGLALGPTLGGVLVAAGGWRLVFLVSVPVGVIGVVTGWIFLPRSTELAPRRPFDWLGLGLFFPAAVALVGAVSFGDTLGWTSAPVLALGVGAVALGVGFVAWERRCATPMIDPALFRLPRVSPGIASSLCAFLVLFGVLCIAPLYLERGLGLDPATAGFELMAMPAVLVVVALFAGRLGQRLRVGTLTGLGMLFVVAGLGTFALGWSGLVGRLVGFGCIGAGLGAFTPANNSAIMSGVPRRDAALGSGLLNMTRGLGTALGLSLSALVFDAAGGSNIAAASVRHGFATAAGFLAAVALLAALCSCFGIRTAVPVPSAEGPLSL